MSTPAETAKAALAKLVDLAAAGQEGDSASLDTERQRWEPQSLPDRSEESWRYSNWHWFMDKPLHWPMPEPSAESLERLHQHIGSLPPEHFLLVFYHGRWLPALSRVPSEDFVRITAGPVSPSTTSTPCPNENGLQTWLKLACQHTTTISVADHAYLPQPIHVLHYLDQPGTMTTTRLILEVGEGADVTWHENHVHDISDEAAYCGSCQDSRFTLNADSNLTYLSDDRPHSQAWTYHQMTVSQAASSRYQQHIWQHSGAWSKRHCHIQLHEPEAKAECYGLIIADEQQYLDQWINIEHEAGQCTSTQRVRSLANDKGTATYNGRVVIRQGADGSRAEQHNKNLLLAKGARVNAKPELEIYADEVSCAHGSTIGQLNDGEIFYLQSRGIPVTEARWLLTRAFIQDILDACPLPEPARQLEEDCYRRLTPPEAPQTEAAHEL